MTLKGFAANKGTQTRQREKLLTAFDNDKTLSGRADAERL